MGKRLIIQGADFSTNGMKLINNIRLIGSGTFSGYKNASMNPNAEAPTTITGTSISANYVNGVANIPIDNSFTSIVLATGNGDNTIVEAEIYDTDGNLSGNWFPICYYNRTLKKLTFESPAVIRELSYAFNECPSLTELDFSNCNFSNLIYTNKMFNRNCGSLQIIKFPSNMDVTNLQSGTNMFSGCSGLLQDIYVPGSNMADITTSGTVAYMLASALAQNTLITNLNLHCADGVKHWNGSAWS